MNDNFDPPSYARDVEESARAGGWTVRHLSPTASSARPWLQRAAPAGAPRVYFSAGIHGDEISGPLALLEMLRQPDFFAAVDATIFPILNPDGLARGVRENADGIDLNRDYRNPKSAEIAGHIDALKTLGRFDAAMMLHEDFEGIGAYLYELNDALPPTLGNDIIAAMGRHVPIDLRPAIEDVPARGGSVISRRRPPCRNMAGSRTAPTGPRPFTSASTTRKSAITTGRRPKPLSHSCNACRAQIASGRRRLLRGAVQD